MQSRITSARHVDGYTVRLSFADGFEGNVDLWGELSGEVFEPLKQLEYFKSFTLHPELHSLVWPNGADFAAEFLRGVAQSAVSGDGPLAEVSVGKSELTDEPTVKSALADTPAAKSKRRLVKTALEMLTAIGIIGVLFFNGFQVRSQTTAIQVQTEALQAQNQLLMVQSRSTDAQTWQLVQIELREINKVKLDHPWALPYIEGAMDERTIADDKRRAQVYAIADMHLDLFESLGDDHYNYLPRMKPGERDRVLWEKWMRQTIQEFPAICRRYKHWGNSYGPYLGGFTQQGCPPHTLYRPSEYD